MAQGGKISRRDARRLPRGRKLFQLGGRLFRSGSQTTNEAVRHYGGGQRRQNLRGGGRSAVGQGRQNLFGRPNRKISRQRSMVRAPAERQRYYNSPVDESHERADSLRI